MKALTYWGCRDIRLVDVADPAIETDTDAIVAMELCGICGSDLHLYHGQDWGAAPGFCIGHEAVGRIVELGKAVRDRRLGELVMLPATPGCGVCVRCRGGKVTACLTSGLRAYGLSDQLPGSQAEYVRVPVADFNAIPIPEKISPAAAVALTDNLPTAWFGCRRARVRPGGSVAVVGLGPIGLMTIQCALAIGAGPVVGVDPCAYRREVALGLGAEAVEPAHASSFIAERTAQLGVECVIEAVGSTEAILLSLDIVGTGGAVAVVGVNLDTVFPFPMGLAMAKSVRFSIGPCPVPRYWPTLIPMIQHDRLDPEQFVSHRFPLAEGARAYQLCDSRAEGVLKVVMTPHA